MEIQDLSTLTRADIVPMAQKIYAETIKPIVEPEHIGKYLVIDIETGEFDMDVDAYAASLRAYHRKPKGLRYGMRIGHEAAGRMGWGRLSNVVSFR